MALADLRALARSYVAVVVVPGTGTPGTRDPEARGSGPGGAKGEEIHGFQGRGTHGTRSTREIGNPREDVGASPATACPGCGLGVWWRVPALSGGPGPWRCERCSPPDPADWIDASAVPI